MPISAVGFVTVLLVVVTWHELGHLVAGIMKGIPIRRVNVGFGPTLWQRPLASETELVVRAVPLGMSLTVPGRRNPDGALRRPISHDFAMAAGGPLASFLLTALAFLLARYVFAGGVWFDWWVAVGLLSTVLALLNLLPIPGLDGGHLLVLSAAWLGWQLAPHEEVRLHRYGLQALVGITLVPLVFQAWTWLVG